MSQSNITPLIKGGNVPSDPPLFTGNASPHPNRLHQVRALAVQAFTKAVAHELEENDYPVVFCEDNPVAFHLDPRVASQIQGLHEVVKLLNATREFSVELSVSDHDMGVTLAFVKDDYALPLAVHFSLQKIKGFKGNFITTDIYDRTEAYQHFDLTRWEDAVSAKGNLRKKKKKTFIEEIMHILGQAYVAERYEQQLNHEFYAHRMT